MLQSKMQAFDDGVVTLYTVNDSSEDGDMPVDSITLKKTLRYKERTVGINRYFAAKQANTLIKYVLRCPRLRDISTQDIAIPNDGQQYKIVLIQYPESVTPPVMDLTLEAVAAKYTIYQPEEGAGEGGT